MSRPILPVLAVSLLGLGTLGAFAAEPLAEPHVLRDHPAVIIAKRAIPTEGESAGTGNIYPHPAWGFLRLADPSHGTGGDAAGKRANAQSH